jgi:peptidylprolyl isomerase
MRPHRLLALFPLLAACGSGVPATIETTSFAASLNVDLAHSTKTPDGLYYRDLAIGTGPAVAAGQTLQVDYLGAFPNGQVFDGTAAGQAPLTFQLGAGAVIAGFDEGLPGATVGTTRQLIIPPELAYGDQGFAGVIPPNAILVFTVLILPRVEDASFAASLGVDLAQSTRSFDGVYVRDLVAGTGASLANGQTVQVHYTAALVDGTQVDANGENDPPFSFKLGAAQVIAGWDEGLAGARVGTTRQLVIPSWLAYGPAPHGTIPPNSILVFSVQILSAQ